MTILNSLDEFLSSLPSLSNFQWFQWGGLFILIIIVLMSLPSLFRIVPCGWGNKESSSTLPQEGKQNRLLENVYPLKQPSIKKVRIDDVPQLETNLLSSDTSRDIFLKYPLFQLGTYEQVTNNIKFPQNPDNGTSLQPELSDTLYANKTLVESNIVSILPPVSKTTKGRRVGYYQSEETM